MLNLLKKRFCNPIAHQRKRVGARADIEYTWRALAKCLPCCFIPMFGRKTRGFFFSRNGSMIDDAVVFRLKEG